MRIVGCYAARLAKSCVYRANGCTSPSRGRGGNLPVSQLTYADAEAFALQ